MKAWAIIVAAGSGERFDAEGKPKAFHEIAGRSMFMRAVDAALGAEQIEGIVAMVPEIWIGAAAEQAMGHPGSVVVEIRPGGATRQASVALALAVVPDDVDAVVVHDAARPLATSALFGIALAGLADADGAVCAVPVVDTLKRVSGLVVTGTAPRDGLWRAQTPQAFRTAVLRDAHARALDPATDDAALLEQVGARVVVVAGDERNIKVTTLADAAVAEVFLS